MGYNRFQIGFVFVITTFIKNLIYIRFGLWYNFHTVLFKFLETETSDRCHMYRSSPEILMFNPIPFHFSFTAPLNKKRNGLFFVR